MVGTALTQLMASGWSKKKTMKKYSFVSFGRALKRLHGKIFAVLYKILPLKLKNTWYGTICGHLTNLNLRLEASSSRYATKIRLSTNSTRNCLHPSTSSSRNSSWTLVIRSTQAQPPKSKTIILTTRAASTPRNATLNSHRRSNDVCYLSKNSLPSLSTTSRTKILRKCGETSLLRCLLLPKSEASNPCAKYRWPTQPQMKKLNCRCRQK